MLLLNELHTDERELAQLNEEQRAAKRHARELPRDYALRVLSGGVDEVGEYALLGEAAGVEGIDDDDVGSFPDLKAADLGVPAECSRAVDGCHRRQLTSGVDRAVEMLYALQQSGGLHFGEEILAVVAAHAVAAQPDRDTSVKELGYRRDAAAEFGVADWAVRDCCATLGDQFEVAVI